MFSPKLATPMTSDPLELLSEFSPALLVVQHSPCHLLDKSAGCRYSALSSERTAGDTRFGQAVKKTSPCVGFLRVRHSTYRFLRLFAHCSMRSSGKSLVWGATVFH